MIGSASETFIDAHAHRLPARVTVIHGTIFPYIGEKPVLSQSLAGRFRRKLYRIITRKRWDWEITASYLTAFKKSRAKAVLAEYGPMGVRVLEACKLARIPLTVHFHGYDASIRSLLDENIENYRHLFIYAAAIIAVSKPMMRKLLSLGAPAEKTHYNPCGVDVDDFSEAHPGSANPVFLSVGRFVEKKAPYLTLIAFSNVHRQFPEARLRMIGEGPFLPACQDLAKALEIEEAVTFLGSQTHAVVRTEMQNARAFVQHSIEAANGDSEGMPVAILEAGATGLPVVATRHAGIQDAVAEETTGFLVDERNIREMASKMLFLAKQPLVAEKMGQAARKKIIQEFSMSDRINSLWSIIKDTIDKPASLSHRQMTENNR